MAGNYTDWILAGEFENQKEDFELKEDDKTSIRKWIEFKLPHRLISDEQINANEKRRQKLITNMRSLADKQAKATDIIKKNGDDNRNMGLSERVISQFVPYHKDRNNQKDNGNQKAESELFLESYYNETNVGKKAEMLYKRIKEMAEMLEAEPKLFDLNQSDEDFAANYHRIFSALSPSIQAEKGVDEIVRKIENAERDRLKALADKGEIKPDDIEERVKAVIPKDIDKIKKAVTKAFDIYSKLKTRADIFLNPMYSYIGTTRLPYNEMMRLVDDTQVPGVNGMPGAVDNYKTNINRLSQTYNSEYTANSDVDEKVEVYLSNGYSSDETEGISYLDLDNVHSGYIKRAGSWRKLQRKENLEWAEEKLEGEEATKAERNYQTIKEYKKESGGFRNTISGCLDRLNQKNRRGGSDAFEYVRKALEDYLELTKGEPRGMVLNEHEKIRMFRQIKRLAQNYLNGKPDGRNYKAYTQGRIDEMKNVFNFVNNTLSKYESLINYLPRDSKNDLENSELLQATARRSMRNQRFDPDTFAAWRIWKEKYSSLAKAEERRFRTEEIKNSPAIKCMEHALAETVIKDEKTLDKIYEAARDGIKEAEEILALDKEAFIARYNQLVETKFDKYKTGSPEMDNALRTEMVKRMNRRVMTLGLEVIPDGYILTGEGHGAYSYSKRRRIAASLSSAKLDKETEKKIRVKKYQTDCKQELARAMIGDTYAGMKKLVPTETNLHQREMPFVVAVSLLMDKNLTMDEILDPHAKLDVKKAVGEYLKNFKSNKTEKEYANEYRKMVAKTLGKNARKILEYRQKSAENRNPNQTYDIAEDQPIERILALGLFDGFCQQIYRSTMWNEENKEASYEMLRLGNETFEETKARIENLNNDINNIGIQFSLENNIMDSMFSLNTDLKNPGNKPMEDSLNACIVNILQNNNIKRALYNTDPPKNPEEKDLLASLQQFTGFPALSFINKVLQPLSMQEKIALITDPGLKDRFRVEIPADILHIKEGKSIEENRLVVGDKLMNADEKAISFFLKNSKGEELKVSKEMHKGKANQSEKAFLKQFREEICDYCAKMERDGYLKKKEEVVNKISQLPKAMQEYKKVFASEPNSMGAVLDAVSDFVKAERAKNSYMKEPYENIVVGEKTGKELIEAEAKRMRIQYNQLDDNQKNAILSSACAAALQKGITVTMISQKEIIPSRVNDDVIVTKMGKWKEFNEKPVKGTLSKIWNHIKTFFTRRERIEESKAVHQELVNRVTEEVGEKMNQLYFKLNPTLKQICRLNLDNMRNDAKNAKAIIDDAFKRNKAHMNEGYSFVNGDRLSRETAIIAITYAQSFSIGAGTNVGAPLQPGEKISFSPDSNRMRTEQLMRMAAEKYDELMELKHSSPKKADKEMRRLISSALVGMNASSEVMENKKEPDMDEYTGKYATDLCARKELLNYVLKDNAPAEIGENKAEKRRTLKEILNEKISINYRDLAASEYIGCALRSMDVTKGKEVKKNINKLRREICRYKLLADSPDRKETTITLNGYGELYEKMNSDVEAKQKEYFGIFDKEPDNTRNVLEKVTDISQEVKDHIKSRNKQAEEAQKKLVNQNIIKVM